MSSLQMKRMMNAVSVKKKATNSAGISGSGQQRQEETSQPPQDTQQGSKLSRGLI